MLSLIDVVDSALKGPTHLKALGSGYWISSAAFIVLAVVGIVTPKRPVQAMIALAYLGLLVLVLLNSTAVALLLHNR